MKKIMRKLPPMSGRQDFIFNMFGSTCNAAVSVLLLMFVSQILGEENSGLFALAFPLAQMFYVVAAFEVRNVQITDVQKQFSFSTVMTFRLITILVMAISCVCFILGKHYLGPKGLMIGLFCVYMAILAISDAYQGLMHLNGYLSLAGKSLGYRTVTSAVAYVITLVITQDLIISAIPMIIVAFIWVLVYDIPICRNFDTLHLEVDFKVLKNLFLSAFPLFLSVFLQQYILNAPKLAIDAHLGAVEQSQYGYLIMPVAFINLFSIFIFRPQLVTLSNSYASGDLKDFKKRIFKLFGWIAAATVFCMVVGYLIGIPVLNILYNTELDAYRMLFVLLMFSGGLGAAASLAITMLTVMKKQHYGLISFGAVALFSLIVPSMLVEDIGFTGAAYAYTIEMALLFLGLMITYWIALRKRKKELTQ